LDLYFVFSCIFIEFSDIFEFFLFQQVFSIDILLVDLVLGYEHNLFVKGAKLILKPTYLLSERYA
jgi:hypothetical protein